jgi:hypothetical protein
MQATCCPSAEGVRRPIHAARPDAGVADPCYWWTAVARTGTPAGQNLVSCEFHMSPQAALPLLVPSRHEHITPGTLEAGHCKIDKAEQPPLLQTPERTQAEALWHNEPSLTFDWAQCQLKLTLLFAPGVLGRCGVAGAFATQDHWVHEPGTFRLWHCAMPDGGHAHWTAKPGVTVANVIAASSIAKAPMVARARMVQALLPKINLW